MDLSTDQLLGLLRSKPRYERISTIRALYGLSQSGLARIADVSRGTVSTWEAPVHDTEEGRGHEPGKIARSRMGAYFNVPAYVFTDEWGNEDVVRKKRKTKRQLQEEAIIRVPAPTNVKRIG